MSKFSGAISHLKQKINEIKEDLIMQEANAVQLNEVIAAHKVYLEETEESVVLLEAAALTPDPG